MARWSHGRPKVFIPLTQLCAGTSATTAPSPRRRAVSIMPICRSKRCWRSRAPARRPAAPRRCSRWATSRRPGTRPRDGRWTTLGHATTLSYLREAAGRVMAETGLLPHINAGIMDAADFAALRPVCASMGLMLESTAARLGERGGPHFGSPDKAPAARLETLREAGKGSCPVHHGPPDRHRRDPGRTHRHPARDRGRTRRVRPYPGSDRPELPSQARHADGGAAGAGSRRSALDDRGRAADPGTRHEHPGAAEPVGPIQPAETDRGRNQRLGRRVAGDARPRQSGGRVA